MQTDNNKYRNTKLVKGIDRGALWVMVDDKMVLADEDQYVAVNFDPRFFVADNLYIPSAHRPARSAKA